MGETFLGTTTNSGQNDIISYVDLVLMGPKARELRGSMPLAEMSGSPDERYMFGGLFLAAVLHYRNRLPAPVTDSAADPKLWREGFRIFHSLDAVRERGRIPPNVEKEIMGYSRRHDDGLAIGQLLLDGLRARNLNAQYIAKDAYLALRSNLGHDGAVAA